MNRGEVTDADLHALVDGQLDAARIDDVLARLQAHPEDAVRVAGGRRSGCRCASSTARSTLARCRPR